VSFDQLRARRADVTKFLNYLRTQRDLLEKAKSDATNFAYRVALQAELDKVNRLIEAAEQELRALDAELERARAAAASSKGEVRAAAERAVSALEKSHSALVNALERALAACEDFIAAAREVEVRLEEARRLGEILGEPIGVYSKLPGGARLTVAELKNAIESHLRTIRGWGR